MYVETTADNERPLVVQKVLMDLAGGAPVAKADFKTESTEMSEGAILGKGVDGLYHIVKTALVVAGGSLSAPRVALNHELKVDDVISDGLVALTIASITKASTYDTLTFDSGAFLEATEGAVLYEVETEDTTGTSAGATATVQDTVGDFLTVTFPTSVNADANNGIDLVIEQAADDVLAVEFAGGVLTISLAKTTAAKNNLSLIQAAIRALGTVEGVDLAGVTCTGVDWDGKQTGATLTTASDSFAGGIDFSAKVPKYNPDGVAMNSVDLTLDNQGCGLLVAGSVIESILPYPVNTAIKSTLNLIKFL